MIAAAPTAAASQFTDVISAARAYINSATGLAADGLTWVEVGELLLGLLRLTISAAEVLNVPGEQKKAVVLEAAAWLFDAVADKAVPAIAWPVWMLARSPVSSLVLALASGAVEILVPMVRAN